MTGLPHDYIPLNGCASCGRDFTSLASFDRHRVGRHAYTFDEGLRLDPPREDGRRCLDADELLAAGLERVAPGAASKYDSRLKSGVPLYWDPVQAEGARERFRAASAKAVDGLGDVDRAPDSPERKAA